MSGVAVDPPSDEPPRPVEALPEPDSVAPEVLPEEPDVRVGIEVRDLRKRFGDTRALDGLSLVARPGEVLGVAGPNGAGKSTLIRILAGESSADSGELLVDGRPWDPTLSAERVAVVHQEPQLFPNLTVAENLIVGREGRRWIRRGANAREQELMAELGIAHVAHHPLERLPLAAQQRTEIARALARDARVFLFDEPNSALTEEESDDLFRRMHALAQRGRVVILVSHRIAELVAHSDRVAVILDGQVAKILAGGSLTQDAIARELVVGEADRQAREGSSAAAGDRPALRVRGWTHARGEFADVDLAVAQGEIVALVGVEGSGARELVRSIAGVDGATGELEIDGVPRAHAGQSTGFVPADRTHSLFSNLSVAENMVSRLGPEITGIAGSLRRRRMAALAAGLRDRFRVRARALSDPIRSLSGGNQQKVAIAAAVVKGPRVLVLEEPTRGVDIGSKGEIYRLLREYATLEHAVILFCTEVPEVFEAADRAHVVSDGRVSAPLSIETFPDVETLASAITQLEEHGRDGGPVPLEPATA